MKQVNLFAVLLAVAATAHTEPLSVRDLNPLLTGYELPPALPSTVAHSLDVSAAVAISNTSLDQQAGLDSLQLDAELQRWQLGLATPLSNRLSLRIELPYVDVSGGRLDSFIESWHRTFGLPDGNRKTWPEQRLYMRHTQAGNTDLAFAEASRGIGDLTLRMGAELGTRAERSSALWFSVKLPTGNAEQLTGSGAVDTAVSLALSQHLGTRITSQQQLSLSRLGHGKRLAAQQETWVWSGSLGVSTSVTSHWRVLAQLDGHTQVFDTDLRALGSALQLSFGPRYQSDLWSSTLLISEDIAVDTAPDVQFQLDVQRKF